MFPWETNYLEGAATADASIIRAVVRSVLKFDPHPLDDRYAVLRYDLMRSFVGSNISAASLTYGDPPWLDCDDFRDIAVGEGKRAAGRLKFPEAPILGSIEFEYEDHRAHAKMWTVVYYESIFRVALYEPQLRGEPAWTLSIADIAKVRRMEF